MRLKIFTSVCLIGGVISMMFWPWLLATRPRGDQASREALREFAVNMSLLTFANVAFLVGAAVGAMLIVRKARIEYVEGTAENLRLLIERTREDQAQQQK